METITLQHGSGGRLTGMLIQNLFYKHFGNEFLLEAHDSARLPSFSGRMAFTTDSYVINPLVFPGGDIGKLAICGTVNDLAMSGAKPLYISCGFIIEASLPVSVLESVVISMAQAAKEAGVMIVTGDTKVVEKGAADKLFINTAGIGEISAGVDISGARAQPGDAVIVSGSLGDHGVTVLVKRQHMEFDSDLVSDCAPLQSLVQDMLAACPDIHVLRDCTRGGLATALNEIAVQSQVGIELREEQIPVKPQVQAICEILGLDPLYLANEGKLLAIVPASSARQLVTVMRNHPYGREAAIVGEVSGRFGQSVVIRTAYGGQRIVDKLADDQLPRIC